MQFEIVKSQQEYFHNKVLVFFPEDSTMSPFFHGSLAQSVEQLAFNQLVVRSSRTRPTILRNTSMPLLGFVVSVFSPAI